MLRRDSLRVLRWHNEISEILKNEAGGPIRCQIDLTNLCNHKCPWCEPLAYREETIKDNGHSLKIDTVLAALDDLAAMGTRTIIFCGGGEPLVHPKFGLAMVRAKQLGFKIAIITNGTFLDKWYQQVMLADNIRISLDATNAKEHEIQHGKAGDFERICENIKAITEHEVRPEVGIAYVISDCNRDSVPKLEEFRKELGADFIFPREERGEAYGTRDFKHCYTAMATAFIGANGDVQACCDRRDIVFGNLYQKSFKEIWANHFEQAKAIVPQLCVKCVQCHFNSGVEQHIVKDATQSWII